MDIQTATQWAQIGSSVVTIGGLLLVFVQIRSAKDLQNKAAARQLYADFLQFAATEPDAVDSAKGKLTWGSKYEWSVYLWLTALESGWLAFSGDREWARRVASFVRQNRPYLESHLWNSKVASHKDDVKQDFDSDFVAEVERVFQKTRKNADAIA
jgi:hypothetical protein